MISTNNSWTLTNIQAFPSDSPMLRTCFEVDSDEKTVARRISFSNRARSIETEYNNYDPIANCIASNNMKFRVQLFCESKNSLRSKKHITLVQLQRRAGCSLTFNEEYKAIVQASKYGVFVAPNAPMKRTYKVTDNKMFNDFSVIPLEDGVLEQNLENTQAQLLSDGYDSQIFGLEDLASTTNPHGSYANIASKASVIIMTDERYAGIRKYISSIILKKEKDNSILEDSKYIRALALTILGNIMSALSRQNTLPDFIQEEHCCALSFISLLVEDIKGASKNQHNASLAAKCLSILLKDSLEARSQVDMDALTALENAKYIGELSHAKLEKEAQSAIYEIIMAK